MDIAESLVRLALDMDIMLGKLISHSIARNIIKLNIMKINIRGKLTNMKAKRNQIGRPQSFHKKKLNTLAV